MEKIYTCNICEATSDTQPFYSSITSRCRECHKSKVRENRSANVEHYRKYDAERFRNDPRVLERMQRYQQTENGRISQRKSQAKWVENNADKRAAHVILGNAVRDGRLLKPDTCSICGSGGRIHGHHHDYTKPLDVTWLCPTCHTAEHKYLNDGK